jgi:tripartite-type tricarboxylate transporter receptor subunit TctC
MVRVPRRKFLQLAAGAGVLSALPRFARAQAYPSRPVHLVVGFSAGGSTDIAARLIGQWLSQRLGQQFVIDNRPGAGTNIATESVARAPPDGYTLLMPSSSAAINASLYEHLNFNFLDDIAMVAGALRSPLVLEVNPAVPVHSVAELVAYAKANPGKITLASFGNGSTAHATGELFKTLAGINMVHVPYRGSAPMVTDLLGGQVQAAFDLLPTSVEHIKAGKLRALAVTTLERSEVLPNVPTLAETYPGFDASAWIAVGAPKKTPAEIVMKLNQEINAGLADPAIKARLADLGGTPMVYSPAALDKFVADDVEKWGKVVRAAGMKAE